MRLDIYRRAERGSLFSYLVVPEGKRIPEEAINTDWEMEARGLEMDVDAGELPRYAIENPSAQLNTKGYAITSSQHTDDGRRRGG